MGAPLAPVGNVLKVVLRGFVDNLLNEVWENVLHLGFSGGRPSNGDLIGVGNAIANEWASQMAPRCPSPTTLKEVEVTDLTSATGAEAIVPVSKIGTRGDDSIPANAALLITYPSTLRYQGGHPRTYLYVLGNADFNGATAWNTAATAEVAAAWSTFLQFCTAINVGSTAVNSLVCVRYHGKFLPNSGPPHFYLDTPIVIPLSTTNFIGHTEIASQRRRIGRAENSAATRMRAAALSTP